MHAALALLAAKDSLPSSVLAGLERVAAGGGRELRLALASRSDTAPSLLGELCGDADLDVRVRAVSNEASPAEAARLGIERAEEGMWIGLGRRLRGERLAQLVEQMIAAPGRRTRSGRPGSVSAEGCAGVRAVLERAGEDSQLLDGALAARLILRSEQMTGQNEQGWEIASKLAEAGRGVLRAQVQASSAYLEAGGSARMSSAVEGITRGISRGESVRAEAVQIAWAWVIAEVGGNHAQRGGRGPVALQHPEASRLVGLAPGLSETQREETVRLLGTWDLAEVQSCHERLRSAYGVPAAPPAVPVDAALQEVLARGDAHELTALIEHSEEVGDSAAHRELLEQIALHPLTPSVIAAHAACGAWRHQGAKVLSLRSDLPYRVATVLAAPGWMRELPEEVRGEVAGAAIRAGWRGAGWTRGRHELGKLLLEWCGPAEYASWPWEIVAGTAFDEGVRSWVSAELEGLSVEEWELLVEAEAGGDETLGTLLAGIRGAYARS